MTEIDNAKWEKAKLVCEVCQRQYPSFDALGMPYHPAFGGYGYECTAKDVWMKNDIDMRPEDCTREELLEANQKLRDRIHVLQSAADKKQSTLLKIIADLSMKLSIVEGITKIGQTFFWDITKCAERPLHISGYDATTLGAKIFTSFLGINSEKIKEVLESTNASSEPKML